MYVDPLWGPQGIPNPFESHLIDGSSDRDPPLHRVLLAAVFLSPVLFSLGLLAWYLS